MIKIDEEFKSLIPPLSTEERQQLEANLLRDGCRDPLVVWNGTLIDGHNRHEICTRHGIVYEVEEMQFDSREDAMDWMDRNQLGRRNLTKDVFHLIVGRVYGRTKKAVGGDYTSEEAIAQNDLKLNTAEKIGKKYGMSAATVKRAGKFAEEVDKVKAERKETPEPVKVKSSEDVQREQDELMKEAKRRLKEEAKEKAQVKLKARKEKVEANLKNEIGETKPVIVKCDCVKFLESVKPYDLMLTDPPYSTDVPDIKEFAASWLPLALSKMKPTGRAYVCIGAYPEEIAAYLSIAMPDQILVWTYRNTLGPTPKDKYKLNWQAILYYKGEKAEGLDCPLMVEQFSVQDINAPDGRLGDRYHAWQKPIELADRFVRHSTKPGDCVVDPFACTGTFILSAAKLGRTATGCDISAENIAIAKKRGCCESVC